MKAGVPEGLWHVQRWDAIERIGTLDCMGHFNVHAEHIWNSALV
jgi:hypothetical protein